MRLAAQPWPRGRADVAAAAAAVPATIIATCAGRRHLLMPRRKRAGRGRCTLTAMRVHRARAKTLLAVMLLMSGPASAAHVTRQGPAVVHHRLAAKANSAVAITQHSLMLPRRHEAWAYAAASRPHDGALAARR